MWGIIFRHWVNLKLELRFHAPADRDDIVPFKGTYGHNCDNMRRDIPLSVSDMSWYPKPDQPMRTLLCMCCFVYQLPGWYCWTTLYFCCNHTDNITHITRSLYEVCHSCTNLGPFATFCSADWRARSQKEAVQSGRLTRRIRELYPMAHLSI